MCDSCKYNSEFDAKQFVRHLVVAIFLAFFIVFGAILLSLLIPEKAQAQTATYPTQIIYQRTGAGYDYVPSITYYNGVYRMYWCGSRANYPGDWIFYAESVSPSGPFHARGVSTPNTFNIALSQSVSGWDKGFQCDPSVINYKGKWYLYYGGISEPPGYFRTEIGVASSSNGFTFTRLNNGKSILKSHKETTSLNPYGTGQPSALVKDDFIYLFYTDTYGVGRNIYSGGGQFVLRSKDPTFQIGVEARGENGWVTLEDLREGREEPYDRYRIRTAWTPQFTFSNDWGYQPALNQFVSANHGIPSKLELITYDADTFVRKSVGTIDYTLPWNDGPGLTRTFDGQIIVNACQIDNYGSFGGTDVFSSRLGIQGSLWPNLCAP